MYCLLIGHSVGCSPGKHSGSVKTVFADIGDGTVIQQIFPECRKCPLGQYQESKAQAHCSDCPEYYSTLNTESTSFEQCTSKYISRY